MLKVAHVPCTSLSLIDAPTVRRLLKKELARIPVHSYRKSRDKKSVKKNDEMHSVYIHIYMLRRGRERSGHKTRCLQDLVFVRALSSISFPPSALRRHLWTFLSFTPQSLPPFSDAFVRPFYRGSASASLYVSQRWSQTTSRRSIVAPKREAKKRERLIKIMNPCAPHSRKIGRYNGI